MLVTNVLIVATDLSSIWLKQSMATVNCLVASILQNILFCAQQKTCLEQLEIEMSFLGELSL